MKTILSLCRSIWFLGSIVCENAIHSIESPLALIIIQPIGDL
ncbi:MAG: hypothetical protein ACMUEM_07600 [Flavobacteriales bacterium AspAUS03]